MFWYRVSSCGTKWLKLGRSLGESLQQRSIKVSSSRGQSLSTVGLSPFTICIANAVECVKKQQCVNKGNKESCDKPTTLSKSSSLKGTRWFQISASMMPKLYTSIARVYCFSFRSISGDCFAWMKMCCKEGNKREKEEKTNHVTRRSDALCHGHGVCCV